MSSDRARRDEGEVPVDLLGRGVDGLLAPDEQGAGGVEDLAPLGVLLLSLSPACPKQSVRRPSSANMLRWAWVTSRSFLFCGVGAGA